jgi:zinc finger CCCH domain-containing protein 13
MRAWLQKQKKKEEAKNASQAAVTPVAATPVPAETQQPTDAADEPVQSVESVSRGEGAADEQAVAAAEDQGDASAPVGTAVAPSKEVSSLNSFLSTHH